MELDPLLVQRLRVVGRSFSVDRAVLDLAVMHAPRLFGKFPAHVVGVLDQVIAQLLELRAQLAFLLGNDGDRRLLRGAFRLGGALRRGLALLRLRRGLDHRLAAAPERWRHDRLLDLGRAADRAGHEPARHLLVVSGGIGEPALERVARFADEGVADHAEPRTACRCAGSTIGSIISNRRPCSSDGRRARAAATSAGSTSAKMTPGSVSPSARTRPQGSTTSEWPY